MPKNTPIRDHLVVDGLSLRVHPGAVKASWTEAAAAKGYVVAARVRDRLHVALLCRTCGALSVARIFVLVNNRPSARPA